MASGTRCGVAGRRHRRAIVGPAPWFSSSPTSSLRWLRNKIVWQKANPMPNDTTEPDQVLDRLDEIVARGVTVNPDDDSYGDHDLTTTVRRR